MANKFGVYIRVHAKKSIQKYLRELNNYHTTKDMNNVGLYYCQNN